MDSKSLSTVKLKEFKLYKKGKVRDVYDLDGKLLVIATDRISCFDVILPTCIPNKGAILTQLSVFWFEFTTDIIPNHLITTNVNDFPEELKKYEDVLKGRSMLVKKAEPFPFECVVRGYLSGSGWKEYVENQTVCGIKLTKGLKESEKLAEPIFTPATKAEEGHDMNVSQEYMEKEIGADITERLKEISIALYNKAARFAEGCGIIIADTKFEFGKIDDEIILIDEALTPDSSRFWPKDRYESGKDQLSFDKQFVRDYLETLHWDKMPPAPELPEMIVKRTSDKYLQALRMITGRGLCH